jgi:hypothetical protein
MIHFTVSLTSDTTYNSLTQAWVRLVFRLTLHLLNPIQLKSALFKSLTAPALISLFKLKNGRDYWSGMTKQSLIT